MFCPVVCIVGPVVYAMGDTITRVKATLTGEYLCYVGISLFPMVNAILTILIVEPNRTFTFRWTRAAFKGSIISSFQLQSSSASLQSGAVLRIDRVAAIQLHRVAPLPK